MKKTIQQLEETLTSLEAINEECEQALGGVHDAVEGLEDHPMHTEIRCSLAGAAGDIEAYHKSGGEAQPPSDKLSKLEARLAEAMTEHPTVALAIGRLANALALAGL